MMQTTPVKETPEKTNEEKLAELIDKGKKAGKLTSKELMEVMESMVLEPEELDSFYDALEELGIELAGAAYLPLTDDDVSPDIEALKDVEEVTEEEYRKRHRSHG